MSDHDFEDEQEEGARTWRPEVWARILRFAWRYPGLIAAMVGAALLTAGVETGLPLVTRSVIDDLTTSTPIRWSVVIGLYTLLVLVLCVSIAVFIAATGRLRAAIAHDIRAAGFETLQRLSFSYYDERPAGWIMARMTSDCERLSRILAWGSLDLVWGGALMLGMAGAMLAMAPGLGALVLLILIPLAWVSRRFAAAMLFSSRRVRRINARLTALFSEGIAGLKTTKAYERQAENLTRFSLESAAMHGASMRNVMLSALYLPVVLTLGSLAGGAALALGGVQVAGGALSCGTLVAFLTYIGRFFEPVQEVASTLAQSQRAQASAERIVGLIDTVPEIRDSAELRARIAAGPYGPGLAEDGYPEELGTIRFEEVSFAYGAGPPVIEAMSFEVLAGQTIALVGATGGGKSTIVKLLARFYEPQRGRIAVGGVDLRERSLAWLRSKLGIVLQTPHLLSATVAEAIRYGRLEASDAEVRAAAATVGADAMIRALPRGYDTPVGEGGSKLSTGQKQLISFARAVLRDPEILILDEATSAIDPETEKAVLRGMRALMSGRTSFVIAHRLATIRGADRILVIDGGRIVEDGDHAALARAGGAYAELLSHQARARFAPA